MSLVSPYVMCTDNGDGSADLTISINDEDHKFSASVEGDEAVVQYEETLSWRGEIRVSEPEELVFRELMQSEEMTDLLDEWGVASVRRVTQG